MLRVVAHSSAIAMTAHVLVQGAHHLIGCPSGAEKEIERNLQTP